MSTARRLAAFALVAAVLAGAALSATDPQIPSPVPNVPDLTRPGAPPAAMAGVYALQGRSAIMVVDPRTFLTYGPFLRGQLGSDEGWLLDVVRTKSGGKAIVSNFGDSQIHFIDMRVPGNPVHLGATTLPIFPEDLAITPNDKYVLVTDGGSSPHIVSVNITTQAVAHHLNTASVSFNPSAVAVARDGQNVVAADNTTRKVGFFLVNPTTGILTFNGLATTGQMNPANVATSPDGRTAVVVGCNPDNPTIPMGMTISINPGGGFNITNTVPAPTAEVNASQSVVFSRDGSRLYWLAMKEWTGNPADDPGTRPAFVYVYNVVGPGALTYTGTEIPIQDWGAGGCLLGVDAMSIDPRNEFLYVSNPSVQAANNKVAVISLATNRQVLTLVGHPLPAGTAVPTGIAFK